MLEALKNAAQNVKHEKWDTISVPSKLCKENIALPNDQ